MVNTMAKKKESERKGHSKREMPKRDARGHFIKEKKSERTPAKAKERPKREKKDKPKKDPSQVKLSPTSTTFTGPGGMKVQAKVENNGYVPTSWATANQPVEGQKQPAIERSRILTVKEVQAPTGTPPNKMQRSLKSASESKHRQTREEALLVDAKKDLGVLETKEKEATEKLLDARSEKGRKAALNEVARLQNEEGDVKKTIKNLEKESKSRFSRQPGESVQAHRADHAIHRAYAEGNPEMAHKIERAKAEVIDTHTSPTRVSRD